MRKEVIDIFDIGDDDTMTANTLANFIYRTTNDTQLIRDGETIVYVEDGRGNPAKSATFIRETLSDGSTVVNLILEFAAA